MPVAAAPGPRGCLRRRRRRPRRRPCAPSRSRLASVCCPASAAACACHAMRFCEESSARAADSVSAAMPAVPRAPASATRRAVSFCVSAARAPAAVSARPRPTPPPALPAAPALSVPPGRTWRRRRRWWFGVGDGLLRHLEGRLLRRVGRRALLRRRQRLRRRLVCYVVGREAASVAATVAAAVAAAGVDQVAAAEGVAATHPRAVPGACREGGKRLVDQPVFRAVCLSP